MISNAYWTQYWAQGYKTSFGDHYENSYDGIIKEKWMDVFTSLKDFSEVLDLCTGNASIIRLARDNLTNFDKISFTGIDYADIQVKDDLSSLKNINLLFNVDVENLPTKLSRYDLVTSNFGIEYSDINRSIIEVKRVLKLGGKFNFICHHIDSLIISESKCELNLLNKIFEKSQVLDSLESLILELKFKKDENRENHSELWRNRLNEGLAILANQFPSNFYGCDFLSFLKFVLNPKIKNKQEEFLLFKKELLGYKVRLEKMIHAALTKHSTSEFFKLSSKLGFDDIRIEELTDKNGIIAFRLSGQLKA